MSCGGFVLPQDLCVIFLFFLLTLNQRLQPPLKYKLQQWISRLKWRWRALQIVISTVNCRTPRNIRLLNVHCTLGLSLRVILLQCLDTFCHQASSSAWWCWLRWKVEVFHLMVAPTRGWLTNSRHPPFAKASGDTPRFLLHVLKNLILSMTYSRMWPKHW